MAEYDKPLIHGVTAAGDKKPVLVNADGSLVGSGGGGGSIDISTLAKEAKQDTQQTTLTSIDNRLQTANTTLNNQPKAGTPITGATMPTGGSEQYGWLSAIWKSASDIFSNLFGVAAQSADTGNPIKIGGVYRSTPPTLTNGQRGEILLSDRSFLYADHLDFVSTPNNINTADVGSSSTAGNNGQLLITGNPTNNSTASVAGSGNSSFAILVSGAWVGTLQFERSLDNGSTWTAIGAFAAGTQFTTQTTTLNGAFHGNSSSSTNIRVRATAWTSGTANIRILLGHGTGTITIGNPLRLTDPSGNIAAIKAANTPSTASDNALVATLRDAIAAYGFTKATTEISTGFTRPNDTTAYAVSDALSDSTTTPTTLIFAGCGRTNGGSGYIVNAHCFTNLPSFTGTLRLHLFKSTVAATADNSPYLLLQANNAVRIGYIDFIGFTTGASGSNTAICAATFPQSRSIGFNCDVASNSLFGLVEVRSTFAPTANQTFTFTIGVEQN